jgi:hypothetical protein
VQQCCQEHAHGNHLHEASGQREGGLPLDVDRKPATQKNDSKTERDSGSRLSDS